jgi:hypothetical protein
LVSAHDGFANSLEEPFGFYQTVFATEDKSIQV